MKNIFENAFFGKSYKTRDGRKAIYFCRTERNKWHELIVDGETLSLPYQDSGLAVGNHLEYPEWDEDIVSEWQEMVDENRLDKISKEYSLWLADEPLQEQRYIDGFKDGYKAAMKGE